MNTATSHPDPVAAFNTLLAQAKLTALRTIDGLMSILTRPGRDASPAIRELRLLATAILRTPSMQAAGAQREEAAAAAPKAAAAPRTPASDRALTDRRAPACSDSIRATPDPYCPAFRARRAGRAGTPLQAKFLRPARFARDLVARAASATGGTFTTKTASSPSDCEADCSHTGGVAALHPRLQALRPSA